MAVGLTLSSSARLAFIGLSYVYAVKLLDTFLHGIFSSPLISFIVVGLNICAGISQFLFFYTLKGSLDRRDLITEIGGWAGVTGALINLFPKLLALSALLHFYFSMQLPRHSQAIAALSPWAGAVLLFCCCLTLSFCSADKSLKGKKRYVVSGTIGYLIVASIFSKLLYNFVSGVPVAWQQGEVGMNSAGFILPASAAFLCIAFLFYGFFNADAPAGKYTETDKGS